MNWNNNIIPGGVNFDIFSEQYWLWSSPPPPGPGPPSKGETKKCRWVFWQKIICQSCDWIVSLPPPSPAFTTLFAGCKLQLWKPVKFHPSICESDMHWLYRGQIGLLWNFFVAIREGVKKNVFFGGLSQMWVGGVADSQTRSKPPQITFLRCFYPHLCKNLLNMDPLSPFDLLMLTNLI